MKKLTFLLSLLFVTWSVSAQKKADVSRFHNGVFTIKSEVSGIITITRRGNIQTERTAKGVNMIFTVKWISNWLFTLTPTPETIAKYHLPVNALLTVAITKPKKRSYFQITSSNTSARKAGAQVVKIAD